MNPTNDEGPAVRTQTPQEQTKADPAIVTQQATTCLDKVRNPLSAAFGNMPADEYAELVRDIKRNGLISDIVKAADGSILDGWHRYRACIEAGITPRIEPFSYIIEAAAETAGRTLTEAEFVVAQNAHRRHLTAEQRRRVVAELLKADPAKSDRAIGSMAKVDHKTVAAVRRQAEAGGEIPHLTKTTGRDGKEYSKPPEMSPERRAELERKLAEALAGLRDDAVQSAAIKASVRGTPAPQGAWAEVLGQLGAIAEVATQLQESFGDRLQPLPMPAGDMHAKLQARMGQLTASIAKLSQHIGETYLGVDLPAPKAAGGRISEVIVKHGKQSVSVDAHLLRQIADALLKEGRKNAAHISGAQIQAAAGHLKQLVTKGHTNLLELARNELDREVRAEFDRRHPELLAEAREKQEKLSDEIHRWKERNKGTDDYMTQDEFRLLQGCLHPDRQPEAEKEKYGRAFQIIKRMESRIDPSKRKRMTKGWA